MAKRRSSKSSAWMIGAALALAWPAAHARAETALDTRCTGKPDVAWDVQVAGCTEAITLGKFTGKDLAKALTSRAQAYAQTGDLDRSLADIEQVIRLDPSDAFAVGARGDIYLVRKDYDHALADYSKAAALAPDFDLALIGRGIVFLATGKYDNAVADSIQRSGCNRPPPRRCTGAASPNASRAMLRPARQTSRRRRRSTRTSTARTR
ncbi:tetratricopeptide repeat protein [Bradyrhizobium sp. 26S5]|uniref:tetratricopeptide repeat protein n=1 Tax=Bradyrhizobium sp. 26S5 TaxID=3139729 RepID=UPI0030CB2EEE